MWFFTELIVRQVEESLAQLTQTNASVWVFDLGERSKFLGPNRSLNLRPNSLAAPGESRSSPSRDNPIACKTSLL